MSTAVARTSPMSAGVAGVAGAAGAAAPAADSGWRARRVRHVRDIARSPGLLRFLRNLGMLAALAALLPPAAGASDFSPSATFATRCSACHSVGKGDVVGPDLKGVKGRRTAKWLHSFIRSSQTFIRSGDSTAMGLFAKYKKQMPDHPLTEQQIDMLVDFIAAGGPSAGEKVRPAGAATPVEVRLGRDLFLGRVRLARGGAACVSCHVAGAATLAGGGTLASDLTPVYLKYQDLGLAKELGDPEVPAMAELYGRHPLTKQEAFALRAFLFQVARAASGTQAHAPYSMALAIFGLAGSGLFLLVTGRGLRRDSSATSAAPAPGRADPREAR